MLKKLFSRKKNRQTEPKVVVTQPKATEKPNTLAGWQSTLSTESGKARNQALSGLVEQIREGVFSFEDVSRELTEQDSAMIAIELELSVPELSEQQWTMLVTQGFTATVRKFAANNIESLDTLKSLEKATKGKDKAVYRILHDKLDALHAEQRQQDELERKKQNVLDAIQKLAEASYEPMYEAKLKGLVEQWRDIAGKTEADEASFDEAQGSAQSKVDDVRQAEMANQVKVQNIEMADQNRQKLIDQLIERMLNRMTDMDFSEAAIASDQHALTDIQHEWGEIEKHSRATKEEARTFQKVSTAFEVGLPRMRLLFEKYGPLNEILDELNDSDREHEALLHDVDDWLHEVEFALSVRIPEPVAKLKLALEQYQKSLAEHRQKEIDKVRSIRGQLRRCMHAVEDGSLRRASGLYHGAIEKLEGFDLTHHQGIKKQLDETTEALEKLRDWQSYAVLPKKEALIKRMSAMIDQSMDPESRAETIREMQDEWKLLSRGLQNRQQDLWETFHDLAQKAYEPCREYFSEQRHLREVNLDRRKEVVSQLTQYGDMINWDAPDIKEIDRVLQVARNDWRHYTPVDRVANKPVQAEFDKIHQSIFDKMRKEQEVFKGNKQAIIEQAKTLLDLEDIKEATEKAKQLQKDWKHAGMVARKDEQELWKAFREVCDELFDRREKQVNDFKADLEANREKADELIASIESLAKSESVLAEQSVFENLKSQYDQLGTLPKAHYQALSNRYRTACQVFEKSVKNARTIESDQHWQAVIDWVKRARFSDESEADLQESWSRLKVPEAARGLIDGLGDWQMAADEVNQAAMHEKTIDIEILTGVESPEEDASIRMNLQVQRLSEGIGTSSNDRKFHSMVVDWLAIGSVEQDDYDRFEARMKFARNAWLK